MDDNSPFMPSSTPSGILGRPGGFSPASPRLGRLAGADFGPDKAKPVEDAFSRLSSFVVTSRGAILHSALHRSTGFLDKEQSETFQKLLKKAKTDEERNALIESYF